MPLIAAFCLSSTFCLLSLWKPGGHLLRKRCPLGFIWDTSWKHMFLPHANNKGTDKPAHPHSLISAFVGCCLDSIISILAIDKISSLYLFCGCAGQFESTLVSNPEDRFSDDLAHLMPSLVFVLLSSFVSWAGHSGTDMAVLNILWVFIRIASKNQNINLVMVYP